MNRKHPTFYFLGALLVATPAAGLGLWALGLVPLVAVARGTLAIAAFSFFAAAVDAGVRGIRRAPASSEIVAVVKLASAAPAGSTVAIRRDGAALVVPPAVGKVP